MVVLLLRLWCKQYTGANSACLLKGTLPTFATCNDAHAAHDRRTGTAATKRVCGSIPQIRPRGAERTVYWREHCCKRTSSKKESGQRKHRGRERCAPVKVLACNMHQVVAHRKHDCKHALQLHADAAHEPVKGPLRWRQGGCQLARYSR